MALLLSSYAISWEQRKLGDLAEIRRGLTYKPGDVKASGIRVLRSSNINEEYFEIYEDDVFVDEVAINIPYVKKGDIIITSANGSSRLVGKHAIIKNIQDNSMVHGGFMLVASADEPEFLNSSMSSPWYTKFINIYVAGGNGAIGNLSKNDLDNQEILVPSIAEQQKIGTYFRTIDNLITLHQRKLDRLKNIKKSMLDKMFPKDGEVVPEIRFKGFTDAWEQRKLGEIGEVITGSTPSTQHSEYYSEDGIPWVTPTDIVDNIIHDTPRKLSPLGEKVGRVVPANTILVTCIASIGKNTMLANMGSFNQQINGLVPYNKKYDPYFLLTESFHWSSKMKREASAGTMQIVNKNEFSAIDTYVPEWDEQKAIGNYFRQLDNLITLHQRKLDKLKNIKKSMLDNMFV